MPTLRQDLMNVMMIFITVVITIVVMIHLIVITVNAIVLM